MSIRLNNPDKQKLIDLLFENNQQHVLKFWDELSHSQRDALLRQVGQIDFQLLQSLFQRFQESSASRHTPNLEQAEVITLEERKTSDADAHASGEVALRTGKVGAVVVAGGQATRMGIEIPKGLYPVTPVKEKSLFPHAAERGFSL